MVIALALDRLLQYLNIVQQWFNIIHWKNVVSYKSGVGKLHTYVRELVGLYAIV